MKSLLLPFAFLLASASASAAGPISVSQSYSHPTAAPGVPGVGFLTLTNAGKKPDRLLSVSSPAAGTVEIHQSGVVNGVMQMRAITDGLALPAGKTVALAPGGLHLMLFDLRAPLVEGQEVPVTLNFANAGAVTTALTVKPRDSAPAAEPEDHSQHLHSH